MSLHSNRSGPQDPEPTGAPAGIPVVAIGGSAGALTPFEEFFKAMPADSGAAFVVIQHLLPDHKSLLPEILAQHTRMRVVQARDGMATEPNCVYIIPPDYHLAIRKGVLFLSERPLERGPRLPIDIFFRSLAEDLEERAICIVFSGAGSDGTSGARAIRGGGGLVIVQELRTAQFPEMPGSVDAAGLADHILPPERMPQAVLQYLEHPYVKGQERDPLSEAREKPRDIRDILALVLTQTGCDFRWYKPATILRRIGRRMSLHRMPETAQYAALLQSDPNETKLLFRDLLINVTSFFRDPEAFVELRDKVIEPLIRTRTGNEPLRIWVPACATGEEAYTLAILFMEQLAQSGKTCPLQVFATDIDEEALDIARDGFYLPSIEADVSSERLSKFFVQKGTGYQVKPELREALTFATHNLITDPPFSKVELISCRNLLIYLNTDAQAKLMAIFNFALKPGGHLFLGRSESLAGQIDLFEPVSKIARICRRLAPPRPMLLDSPLLPGKRRAAKPAHPSTGVVASNFADVIRVEILRHFGANAVLIDRKGRILQFHGETNRYLNLPAPGPLFNVFELAKGDLAVKLRLAVHKALQDGKPITLDDVPFAQDGGPSFVRVTATPIFQDAQEEPLLVAIFEDVSGPVPNGAQVVRFPESEGAFRRLEDELRASQQDLHCTIQELQGSNEELRASNEEVSSSNEELESTNEELMSSTEELQSANTELASAVTELQQKVTQLDQANTEITRLEGALRRSEERFRNLVESLPSAVLLVDADETITLANRRAESMFGYTRDELLGQSCKVLSAQLATRPQKTPLAAVRDLVAVRKDGTEFPVEIDQTPLDMPEGLVTLVTINDITARKRREAGA
jgi:two-component system, chemotaxis family, CheB/CheR fusion protein